MIRKADKGNTVIITYTSEYNKEVNNFINSNNFIQDIGNTTCRLQRDIRSTINECQYFIPKEDRWKYINVNPTTPTIRGLIKIHKAEAPIRPIINWENAPAYKIAKTLAKILNIHIPLHCAYNVKSFTQLINDMQVIKYNRNLRLASFDVTNMYTNVSSNELLGIIDTICQNNNIDRNIKTDITRLSEAIINQNYFQFMDQTYMQIEGLAMGAPTSSILSEIYLQFLEKNRIYNILTKHIKGYFRYVDDILTVYDVHQSNIEDVLLEFNKLAPKLKFAIEKEEKQKINFLDLTIHRKRSRFSIDIYRKPTTTDTIIANDFCHPREQKMAAIHNLHNRMMTYDVSPENRQNERHNIQLILRNNKYIPSIIKDMKHKKEDRVQEEKIKWEKFTYIGRETRFITKAFKNTKVRITFTTDNTIKTFLLHGRSSIEINMTNLEYTNWSVHHVIRNI